jgi:hypothetical protein
VVSNLCPKLENSFGLNSDRKLDKKQEPIQFNVSFDCKVSSKPSTIGARTSYLSICAT